MKSALRFINELKEDIFKYKFVVFTDGTECTYTRWETLLLDNFEKYFFVPVSEDQYKYFSINKTLVNQKGIYKDTLNASTAWADYQLRPNACIALAVAPELFNPVSSRV